jgi:hypothetical protein
MATTTGGNHDFYDTSSGKHLGRIPSATQIPTTSISPDGKMLVRLIPGSQGASPITQVWNLENGKRSTAMEIPVISPFLGSWVGPRRLLTYLAPAEKTPGRYLVYDFDIHTHTLSYDEVAGISFRTDSLGRGWMVRGGEQKVWRPIDLPRAGALGEELAFAPGSTIRVEIDAGSRSYNGRIATQLAGNLQKRGYKIGRGGWVLRIDHTIGKSSVRLDDPSGKPRPHNFISLSTTSRLIAPDGSEVWQNSGSSSFSPFTSKYVIPGSRTRPLGPQGGYETVQLDFGGQNAQLAQIEELLDQMLYARDVPVGMPAAVAKSADGYAALPIKAKLEDGKK